MAQPPRETGRLTEVLRTCIGCRERADKTTLVRVVAAKESTTTVVTPDLSRSLPGRGAHLHPTARCLELATRRKAFGRALRVEGSLDLNALSAMISESPPAE
ncbi:YlxR family protein [Aeromicrobium panaciterrae]|uniref:YlxR family protein n=1 Tax=Aeromicrobium panaciterrae TaxID=363861 RepID=UPI00286AAD90|nr:YlxR family protein [Aeromicrobium panaciterrae]